MDNAINFGIKGNVTIDGSAKENVVIRNLNSKGSFGSFIIVGQDSLSYANINFLRVSGGNAAYFMGRQSTSQFSIFNSNVVLKNAVFEHSNADDGLNIKYSKVLIDSSKFINNLADQVDLDFCFATISNCQFSPSLIDSNGDGLDLSGSYAKVSNCVFAGFLDKGLSIGEKSRVLVNNCKFNENALAIALKDETTLYSWSNYFYTNKEDYTAFVKKPLFKIPNLYLGESSNELKLNLIEVNKFELDENDIQIEKLTQSL